MDTKKPHQSDAPIDGISCSVCDCEYHQGDDSCHAHSIHVGHTTFMDNEKSDCTTYRKSDDA